MLGIPNWPIRTVSALILLIILVFAKASWTGKIEFAVILVIVIAAVTWPPRRQKPSEDN
jgi:hypothetical protein